MKICALISQKNLYCSALYWKLFSYRAGMMSPPLDGLTPIYKLGNANMNVIDLLLHGRGRLSTGKEWQ